MTFTETELRAWIAKMARTPALADVFRIVELALVIGHIHGVEVARDHCKNKFDRKRLQNLLDDARKALP